MFKFWYFKINSFVVYKYFRLCVLIVLLIDCGLLFFIGIVYNLYDLVFLSF